MQFDPTGCAKNFYPRPPRGGRPLSDGLVGVAFYYFHPRPPRGGRPRIKLFVRASYNFYPRPPRGGRLIQSRLDETKLEFLSTPSARRATLRGVKPLEGDIISIHALREEGDVVLLVLPLRPRLISIHALREEGDEGARVALEPFRISIHALREEGDRSDGCGSSAARDFYPRPPRGGRPPLTDVRVTSVEFLSTPSARRATLPHRHRRGDGSISIHALREEGDSKNRDKISIFKQIIQHSARI